MSVQTFSIKSQGSEEVSDNFRVCEFKCKDGSDTVLIDVDFQAIRNHFGKAVTVTSGYRTESYNKRVGGAEHSYHKKGRAFDIQIAGVTPLQVAQYAESIGVLGVIVYSSFTHVDSRTVRYFSKDGGKSSCSTFGGQTQASTLNERTDLIKLGQQYSIDFTGNEIKVDGIRGAKTIRQAGMVLQTALNLDYQSELKVDGKVGSATKKALGEHYVKHGETQFMVTACEILLLFAGENPGGVESPGKFGNNLEACVKQYQTNHDLNPSGICDAEMFLSLVC